MWDAIIQVHGFELSLVRLTRQGRINFNLGLYDFRYKSDVDDNSLWLHPNVFPMWDVQTHTEVDASSWLLSTYDVGGMHQVYKIWS